MGYKMIVVRQPKMGYVFYIEKKSITGEIYKNGYVLARLTITDQASVNEMHMLTDRLVKHAYSCVWKDTVWKDSDVQFKGMGDKKGGVK
jgi:hypothetical protein